MQRFILERKGRNAKTSEKHVSRLAWKGQEQVGPVLSLVWPSADHCSGRSMDRDSLGLALCVEPRELGLDQPLPQHCTQDDTRSRILRRRALSDFGSVKKREALETEAPFQGAVPPDCWT
jgi:hypothetical protein